MRNIYHRLCNVLKSERRDEDVHSVGVAKKGSPNECSTGIIGLSLSFTSHSRPSISANSGISNGSKDYYGERNNTLIQ